jgi:hypothetical protein
LLPYSLTEFCFDAADELQEAYPNLKAVDGLYGNTGQHAWNIAADGTIVDVTHGQFDPHTPVKIIRPGEPGYDLYQPGRYSHTSALPPDRIWRGESRPVGEDPSQAASIGMHWTEDPSAALVNYRDDEPDLQNVMWQARRNPATEIPSQHPIWQGRGRPFSWEREVRLMPGQQAQVEGYYTWQGGGMPQPFTLREHGENYDPNWAWTPMEQSLPVEHKGWIPYQERHPDLFKTSTDISQWHPGDWDLGTQGKGWVSPEGKLTTWPVTMGSWPSHMQGLAGIHGMGYLPNYGDPNRPSLDQHLADGWIPLTIDEDGYTYHPHNRDGTFPEEQRALIHGLDPRLRFPRPRQAAKVNWNDFADEGYCPGCGTQSAIFAQPDLSGECEACGYKGHMTDWYELHPSAFDRMEAHPDSLDGQ